MTGLFVSKQMCRLCSVLCIALMALNPLVDAVAATKSANGGGSPPPRPTKQRPQKPEPRPKPNKAPPQRPQKPEPYPRPDKAPPQRPQKPEPYPKPNKAPPQRPQRPEPYPKPDKAPPQRPQRPEPRPRPEQEPPPRRSKPVAVPRVRSDVPPVAVSPSLATPFIGGASRPRQAKLPPRRDLIRSRTREVIIAVADTVTDDDTLLLGSDLALNVEVQHRSALLGLKIVRLRIPNGRRLADVIAQVTRRAALDGRIVYVQPNFVFETVQATAGRVAGSVPQYSTTTVRLLQAHQIALGRGVRVAVVDTGLDGAHPELAGAVIESFDAVGEGPTTIDAHGTAIAGIVAARQQMTGMAPDSQLLAVRAFSAGATRTSEATTLSIIKGLDWAAANGARVVNMSFAGPQDQLLQLAIVAGVAKGQIYVAAAGNGGPGAASAYPAAYEQVIAVTAIDSDDRLYAQANRGRYVALAAPGVDILAPALSSAYAMSSGTSLAAAHVSGIIALMLERRPTLTTEQARVILLRTARPPTPSTTAKAVNTKDLGAGIIDAARAVADLD